MTILKNSYCTHFFPFFSYIAAIETQIEFPILWCNSTSVSLEYPKLANATSNFGPLHIFAIWFGHWCNFGYLWHNKTKVFLGFKILTLMHMSIDPWIVPYEQLNVKAVWSSKLLPPAQKRNMSRRSSRSSDFPFVDSPCGMASLNSSANSRKASFDKRKFLLKYDKQYNYEWS